MTAAPDKIQQFLHLQEHYRPKECFREWQCEKEEAKGAACYRSMPFKSVVDQLDENTKAKVIMTDPPFCPQPYVDLVNHCLYGPKKDGCPKDIGDPYRLKS